MMRERYRKLFNTVQAPKNLNMKVEAVDVNAETAQKKVVVENYSGTQHAAVQGNM